MIIQDIKELTKNNTDFRRVLYTGAKSQLVLMNIKVGEEIGEEVHEGIDQLLFIVDGKGEAILGGERKEIEEHDVVFVEAGVLHNIINTGDESLKLYTVYSPPEHAEGTVHVTKEEAMLAEHV